MTSKNKNGGWEYKCNMPWADEQMCKVNGFRRYYIGKWGDDAMVCFHGHPEREGGLATVAQLRSRPDRYKLEPPTMPRTHN